MRAHTITTTRPALLLSLLALGALGLLVGGGVGPSAAATPQATQAITTVETTITKRPPKGRLVRKKTVTFEFIANQPGATFECALRLSRSKHRPDLVKPFAPCASPFKVKVGKGKHVLKVRATVSGVTDDTPARATWHSCAGC